jgi:23S rRNA (guanosine2251-2'-O)-methyltransferase
MMRKLTMDELNRLSMEEYKKAHKAPVIFALDNVRSMHNVGSAFRTADAFRIEKIILGGITGCPPHREINKTALGATESVAWEHAPDLVQTINTLRGEGYTIASFEQTDKSMPLHQFAPDKNGKYCFVFGNEVFGIEDTVLAQSDVCLEIPQFGAKHSLNVSVSIGIAVWDYYVKTILRG